MLPRPMIIAPMQSLWKSMVLPWLVQPSIRLKITSAETKEKHKRGIWYSFVGNGRIMTVTTCHDATDFYSELYVSGGCQQGCYPDQLAKSSYCQNTDDDSTDEFYTKGRNFMFGSVDGKEYHVLISGDTLSTMTRRATLLLTWSITLPHPTMLVKPRCL